LAFGDYFMADVSIQQNIGSMKSAVIVGSLRSMLVGLVALAVVGIAVLLVVIFQNLDLDAPLLVDSTLGELAVWMVAQSGEDAPESILGQYAKNWALQTGAGMLDESVLLMTMRNILIVWCALVALAGLLGFVALIMNARRNRTMLVLVLIGFNLLLFVVPPIEGDQTLGVVLIGITLTLLVLLFTSGRVTKVLGFLVILSAIMVAWQSFKAFAASIDYNITLPQQNWDYSAYPTLETALDALQTGEIAAVILDGKLLEEAVAPSPDDPEIDPTALPYPDLRYLPNIDTTQQVFFLPIRPDFAGRLDVAVPADRINYWHSLNQLLAERVGTVTGDFAETNYLAIPRHLILLDLKILNDLNLPHLQHIAEAFLQPARRNGPLLLVRILAGAGVYTWQEALFGFALGASLGFILGTLFAHSRLLERGLLPYVVASQTVPILAIAPMVVIWLGAGPMAVAVIAAYITFFPVTINTMRGLQSPNPMALELMHSYAASKWEIMWKLRFPAALPYIFTALKVSATASVVGAIIGELPSSIRDGLGRAILDFSSDYSLISTPKLWAAIIMAAVIGIIFFVIISLIERFVLRGYIRSA
jgi:NitT/TauT family transport system permease protein